MTSLEAYKKFELKLNGADTASNVDISIGEFIMIYNEQQPKWFSRKFMDRSSRYAIDEVESLVELDKQLTAYSTKDAYKEFELPANYFDYIKSYTLATRGNCKNRRLRTFEVKLLDIERYITDEYNKPSFEFNETPVTLAQNKLQVYKTDFSIESVFLTYYRYPMPIDIAGYTKVNGPASTTIDPELPDDLVDEVIDLCVLEVQRAFQNPDGFQLSTDRVNKHN
jgi:hypothetical protein